MQIGGHARADREQCSALDVILDKLDDDFTEFLDKVEGGGLDQLDAAETVAVWQRFEAFRNRLPLLDHSLIAAADAFDLPGTYCCSSLGRFLVRIFQLSHGEAAARVRAAAAVGPRTSMVGERLAPQLPRLAALQREGAVSTDSGTSHAEAVPTRLVC
jgi:Domain of unknown function (DUF222)